jgi:putative tryptophan/tyrosine transport system substrate-binding protein
MMHKLLPFLLSAVLSVAPWPAANAQAQRAAQRIGFLGPSTPPPNPSLLDVFRKAMADLGYEEGRNVVIDTRWPQGDRLDLMTDAAAALAGLKPDVLVVVGATAARAAKSVSSEIPIVFEVVVDPVVTGLVANLERPEGNATGSTTFDPQLANRQLALLKSMLPDLSRVAFLGDAGAAPSLFQSVETAARSLGLESVSLKVERVPNPDFDAAFEAAKKGGAGAILVLSTPVTTPHRKRIAELSLKHRLPTLSPRDHADAGGLASYGTSFIEATRHSASFVHRILNGARPADLPIEKVSRNELVINLKTARELGVTVPPSVLGNASQVLP